MVGPEVDLDDLPARVHEDCYRYADYYHREDRPQLLGPSEAVVRVGDRVLAQVRLCALLRLGRRDAREGDLVSVVP